MLQKDFCSHQDQNNAADELGFAFKAYSKPVADSDACQRQGKGNDTN